MTAAQTQAFLRVPTPVVAVREPEVAAYDLDEGDEVAPRTESVQELYEAGLAKLEALNDRWTVAMAEIRQAQPSGEPQQVAA